MKSGCFQRFPRPAAATRAELAEPCGIAPVPARATIWEIEEEILRRKQLETPYGVWKPEMETR